MSGVNHPEKRNWVEAHGYVFHPVQIRSRAETLCFALLPTGPMEQAKSLLLSALSMDREWSRPR